MTSISITVKSAQLGDITIDLEPFTREIGDSEADTIDTLISNATASIRRAYKIA